MKMIYFFCFMAFVTWNCLAGNTGKLEAPRAFSEAVEQKVPMNLIKVFEPKKGERPVLEVNGRTVNDMGTALAVLAKSRETFGHDMPTTLVFEAKVFAENLSDWVQELRALRIATATVFVVEDAAKLEKEPHFGLKTAFTIQTSID